MNRTLSNRISTANGFLELISWWWYSYYIDIFVIVLITEPIVLCKLFWRNQFFFLLSNSIRNWSTKAWNWNLNQTTIKTASGRKTRYRNWRKSEISLNRDAKNVFLFFSFLRFVCMMILCRPYNWHKSHIVSKAIKRIDRFSLIENLTH